MALDDGGIVTTAIALPSYGMTARIAAAPSRNDASPGEIWLQVQKYGSRAIFTMASKAQAAANWMHAQRLVGN